MKTIDFLSERGVDVAAGLELLGDIETYNETLEEFLKGIDNKIENLQKFK